MVYVLISVTVFYRYLFASTFQSVVAQTMGISVSRAALLFDAFTEFCRGSQPYKRSVSY